MKPVLLWQQSACHQMMHGAIKLVQRCSGCVLSERCHFVYQLRKFQSLNCIECDKGLPKIYLLGYLKDKLIEVQLETQCKEVYLSCKNMFHTYGILSIVRKKYYSVIRTSHPCCTYGWLFPNGLHCKTLVVKKERETNNHIPYVRITKSYVRNTILNVQINNPCWTYGLLNLGCQDRENQN